MNLAQIVDCGDHRAMAPKDSDGEYTGPTTTTTIRVCTMNEEQWQSSLITNAMLRFLIGTQYPRVQAVEAFPNCITTDRKLWLFACACYRRLGHLLVDPLACEAVDIAERFAEGAATEDERRSMLDRLNDVSFALEPKWRSSRGAEREQLAPLHDALSLAINCLWEHAQKAAYYASSNAYLSLAAMMNPGQATYEEGFLATQNAEERAQAELLRCIFGNPFRTTVIESKWLGAQVVSLASEIYEERSFDRLDELANALRGAGCKDTAVLDHCNGQGVHDRGCWVLDVLLQRK